jgi:hypothetical protein
MLLNIGAICYNHCCSKSQGAQSNQRVTKCLDAGMPWVWTRPSSSSKEYQSTQIIGNTTETSLFERKIRYREEMSYDCIGVSSPVPCRLGIGSPPSINQRRSYLMFRRHRIRMHAVEIQLFWSGKLLVHCLLEGIGIDHRKA